MKNIIGLVLKGKSITMVGTAHVSKESVKEVKKIINELKPEVVGIELCKKRLNSIKNPSFSETKLSTIIRKGDFKLLLFQTLLYWYQSRVGKKIKIQPGSEMIEALHIAEKKKIKTALLDRDINVTMSRLLESLSLREKLTLLYSLFESFFEDITEEEVEKLKEASVIDTLIDEVSKKTPSIKKVLIDERDEYIAEQIKALKEKDVLVFLGAGHIKGVKKNLLSNHRKIVIKKKKKRNIAPWIIPIILIAIFGVGMFKSLELGGQMLLLWSLMTGIGALIGGIISFAHPLSIISGALIAPLSALHPLFTSGMVSAFVETKFRKIRVKDLKGIVDITGIKGAYKNNLSRLLIVFMITNLFTAIGSLVGFPLIVSLLF